MLRRRPAVLLATMLVLGACAPGGPALPPHEEPPPPPPQVDEVPTGYLLIDFVDETIRHLDAEGDGAAVATAGGVQVATSAIAFPGPGIARFDLVNRSGRTLVDAAGVDRIRMVISEIEGRAPDGAPVGGVVLMNAAGYQPDSLSPYLHLSYEGHPATAESGLPDGASASIVLEFSLPAGASRVRIGYHLVAGVQHAPAALRTGPGWATPLVGTYGQAGSINGPGHLARVTPKQLTRCGDALYFGDGTARVRAYHRDSVSDHTSAGLSDLSGLGCLLAGGVPERLVATDWATHQVKFLHPDGGVAEVVGDGVAGLVDGPAATARFAFPRGVVVAGQSVVVAQEGSTAVRRLDRVGGVWQVSTLASGLPGTPYDVTWDGVGAVLVSVAGAAAPGLYRIPLTGGEPVRVLADPTIEFAWATVAGLGTGAIVLADRSSNRLHLVTATSDPEVWSATLLAGTGSTGAIVGRVSGPEAPVTSPYGLATDASGTVYVSLWGQGQVVRIDPPVTYAIPLPAAP